MKRRSEKAIENDVKRYIERDLQCWCLKIQGGANSKTTGVPDVFFGYKGFGIFLEIKQNTGVLSEIQKYQITDLRKRQNIAVVVSDVAQVKEVVKVIDDYMTENEIDNTSLIEKVNEMGWKIKWRK